MISNEYNRTFVLANIAEEKRKGKTKNKNVEIKNEAKHVHDWNGCKCQSCGETRDTGHDWNGCKCIICGKIRDTGHDWNGCVCKICGKLNEKLNEIEWLK